MDEAIIDLSSPHTARADSPFVDSPIQRCLSDPGRWRNVSQLSDMSDDASSEHIRNDGTQIVLCSTLSLGSLRCLPRLRGDIKKMLYLYWKMVVAGTEAPASDGPDDEAAGGCAPAGTKRNPRRIFQQVFDRDSEDERNNVLNVNPATHRRAMRDLFGRRCDPCYRNRFTIGDEP
jgi:hypothetical protein